MYSNIKFLSSAICESTMENKLDFPIKYNSKLLFFALTETILHPKTRTLSLLLLLFSSKYAGLNNVIPSLGTESNILSGITDFVDGDNA